MFNEVEKIIANVDCSIVISIDKDFAFFVLATAKSSYIDHTIQFLLFFLVWIRPPHAWFHGFLMAPAACSGCVGFHNLFHHKVLGEEFPHSRGLRWYQSLHLAASVPVPIRQRDILFVSKLVLNLVLNLVFKPLRSLVSAPLVNPEEEIGVVLVQFVLYFEAL